MMLHLHKLRLIAATFVATTCALHAARASNFPADLCSLLPAAELNKITGQTYDSPEESTAGAEAPHWPAGTICKYRSKAGSQFTFIAYVDLSRSAAVDRFAKETAFFRGRRPVKAPAYEGYEAYFDEAHGIRARKGRVRFYVSFLPENNFQTNTNLLPGKEQQLLELVSAVAGRLGNSSRGQRCSGSACGSRNQPHKLWFRWTIPPQCEKQAVSRLEQAGFETEAWPRGSVGTILIARKTMIPDLAALQKIRQYTKSLCDPRDSADFVSWGFVTDHFDGIVMK